MRSNERCQKTRVIAVSWCQTSAVHHLVLSQYMHLTDRRTDGQTDRIATAIPCVALHAARKIIRYHRRKHCFPNMFNLLVSQTFSHS